MKSIISDFLIWIYKINRKTLRLRGGYRVLIIASYFLPKLRNIPISFASSGIYYADVQKPDTYWLLNAYLGDAHVSLSHLAKHLSAYTKPGSVVWDIGGSMGLFSISMLNANTDLGEIHLFEPNPVPLKVATALLGKESKVTMHTFALGELDDEGILFNGDEHTGTGGASISPINKRNTGIKIGIRSGDSLLNEKIIPPPDIIKIDVEGFEPSVLKGLSKTISTHYPVIAIEILFLNYDQINKIIPYGYTIKFIRESDGKLCDNLSDAKKGGCMDALLLHNSHNKL
jgi:FkbM family methyltransferase